MKITNRKVEDLTPYINNQKEHPQEQIDKIASSIKEFGFVQPIVIDSKDEVIIGHGRLLAAKAIGLDKVPTMKLEKLSEAQVKALRIADNKLNESEWDLDMLQLEFESLEELGYNVEMTGFEIDEVELIMEEDNSGGVAEEDDFDVPEEVKTDIKEGDVIEIGDHRLMCGDSTDPKQVDRLMKGIKADMVFTDPPYGVSYDGINNDDREGLEELLTSAFTNYKANSKEGASVYCFHSDRCGDIFHSVFRKFCHFSSMIIWVKESIVLSQTDYQSKHEPCLYGWFDNGTHKWYSDRKQQSVWESKREKIEGHTTPKPISIVAKAINNSSKSKSVILDLFLGSGSTMVASHQLKRKCYGMELDPKYCQVIVDRMKKLDSTLKIKKNGKIWK